MREEIVVDPSKTLTSNEGRAQRPSSVAKANNHVQFRRQFGFEHTKRKADGQIVEA